MDTKRCGARRRLVAAAIAGVLAVGGAACSGDDGGSAGPTTDESGVGDDGTIVVTSTTEAGPGGGGEGACAFVSDEEVEHHLGEVPEVDLVEDFSDDAPVPYTYCEWSSGDGGPMVGVTLLEGTDRYEARAEYVGGDEVQGVEGDPSAIEGLGEEAYVVQTTVDPDGFQVGVRLEDQTLEVTLVAADGATVDDVLTLTQAVLQRL